MTKIKFQRIWSKSSGIRHRMVWKGSKGYFIKDNFRAMPVIHIGLDLWKVQ